MSYAVIKRFLLLITAVLSLAVCGALHGAAAQTKNTPAPEQAFVLNVFDGDTIQVRVVTREIIVRLIGVDTPETGRPETPVQFYGPEATDFTRKTLLGKQVMLYFEHPAGHRGSVDAYGRTLAYVFTSDGKNFNLELIRLGFARAYTKYPFRYQKDFLAAEQAARKAGIGIWNARKKALWSDPALRGKIIGNIRSRIYHLPGQENYDKILEKNRIYFSSEEEAQKAGFKRARR